VNIGGDGDVCAGPADAHDICGLKSATRIKGTHKAVFSIVTWLAKRHGIPITFKPLLQPTLPIYLSNVIDYLAMGFSVSILQGQ
jgi:hypothetical protein